MNVVTLKKRATVSQDEAFCRAVADMFEFHLPSFLDDIRGWAIYEAGADRSYRPQLDMREALVAWLCQQSIERECTR